MTTLLEDRLIDTQTRRKKWNEIRDDNKGRFMEISKNELSIDHTYQRRLNNLHVNRIAKEWSWPKCGTLDVIRRLNGSLIIVDGQHRWEAAQLRPDIITLPCMIFELNKIEDEAELFGTINRVQKKLTSVEGFRSDLIRKDELALKIISIISTTGHGIENSKQIKAVRCVDTLKWAIKLQGSDKFRKAWPLLVEIHGNHQINGRILSSVYWLYAKTEGLLDKPIFRKRLIRAGVSGLEEHITMGIKVFGGGSIRNLAIGLVPFLNKGIQEKNRIKIFDNKLEQD